MVLFRVYINCIYICIVLEILMFDNISNRKIMLIKIKDVCIICSSVVVMKVFFFILWFIR